MNNGEILALLVAKGFEGECGPFGGWDPEVCGNEMILESQCPATGYKFNDDGSVDVFYPNEDDTKEFLIYDCGYLEEDAQDIIDEPKHYDSVLDLLDDDEDGWMMGWERTDLYILIINFLDIIKKELKE